jgi:hypothetical protein
MWQWLVRVDSGNIYASRYYTSYNEAVKNLTLGTTVLQRLDYTRIEVEEE